MTAGLFEPGRIGPYALANRLVVPAHTTNFGRDNLATEQHVDYLGELGASGAALVITEGIRVQPNAAARPFTLGGWDDSAVPGLTRIATTVRSGGARLFGQLLHIGREGGGTRTLYPTTAVSITDWSVTAPIAHQFRVSEIAELVDAFAGTARRLTDSGFDGLEVHAGHGHLLHQFLSPVSNTRTDGYGGSVVGRARVVAEVLDAVRANAGDQPIGLRISADEFLPGGLDPAMMIETVSWLRARFELAYLHVSHSAAMPHPSLSTQIADMSFPIAAYRRFPAQFKREFPDLPVIAVCRLDDLETAGAMVTDGETDFVGIARGHLADPRLTSKWRAGRADTVNRCIACSECIGRSVDNLPVRCVVNPEAGQEGAWRRLREQPVRLATDSPVLVIGGGPAGLSAAAGALERGHRVVLVERSRRLGGLVPVAARMYHRERLAALVEDLERRVRDGGAEIRLGIVADADLVATGRWHRVLIATGARPAPWTLPGRPDVLTPVEAIQRPSRLGATVVIVDDDGGYAGAGLAEHLAHAGHQVRLVSPTSVAWRVNGSSLPGLIDRLQNLGVHFDVNAAPVRMDGPTLTIRDRLNRSEYAVDGVDTVIRAHPGVAQDQLMDELDERERRAGAAPLAGGLNSPLPGRRLIGDAFAPRGLLQAVHEGRLAGQTVGVAADSVPVELPWGA